jgi:predicted phage terminase large subunit-like protein
MNNLKDKIDKLIVDKLGVQPSVEIYKHLFSQNMELFGKYYFPDKLSLPNSPLHKWLYTKTEKILNKPLGKGIRLAVAAPRGSAKSTLMSYVLPIWCLCFGRKEFIILISETAGQAEDFLDDIKSELVNNRLLMDHFPMPTGKSSERWRNDDIITKSNARIRALGCGGKIRGRRHRGVRPDLILLDDVESRESVESEVTRDKLWNQWLKKEVIEAGRTDRSTDILAVGTILHEDSILSKLLDRKQSPEWERMIFKSVYRFADRQDLWDEWQKIFMLHEDEEQASTLAHEYFKNREQEMLEGTEVLWPEGETYYDLMCMCLTPDGMSTFQSEKQNDPIDVTRMKVTKSDLHTFHLNMTSGHIEVPGIKQLPLERLTFYGAWDPSLGKKSHRHDYSAVVTLGRDPDGLIYVIDFDLKRRKIERRMYDILDLHKKWRYKAFAVETQAFQAFIKETLLAKSRAAGVYVPIIEDTGMADTELRVDGLVPYITEGTLLFRHSSEWTPEYREGINQLTGFKAGAKHDDAPVALAMAFEIVKTGVFRRKALISGRTVSVKA